jgi:uncharacterized protein YjdB
VAAGLTEQFTATGKYDDGSTKDLTRSATWQSSNTGLATISSSGLLSSKAQGVVTISASSAGISGTASFAIAPPNLVSIAVSPSSASVASGTTVQFNATGNYTDGSSKDLTSSVTWNSSNPNTATISNRGSATACAQGNATITAALTSLMSAATFTTRAPDLVAIAVNPVTATIAPGTTHTLEARGSFSDGSTVDITATAKWTSSAPSVATVTQGLAKSVNPGTSLISASVGTISGSATLNVTNAKLSSIAITPQAASIPLGTLQQFTAAGSFSDGSTQAITDALSWSSSASSVVSITVSGLATGRNLGSVTITAQWGSSSASASLNVNAADVSSLTILPMNPVIAATTSAHLTATGTFNDGGTRNLTTQAGWTSSDTTVATVGPSSGVVKGLKPGTATITATLGSLSVNVVLTVTSATLVSISVLPSGPSIAPGTKLAFTATGVFSDSSTQVISSDVTWSSDNPAVATVGGSGGATAIQQGTANISAALDSVTGSGLLNVSSAALTSISVSSLSAALAPASILACQATGQFSDGTTQNVTNVATWSSSDNTIATVSPTGIATGQSGGTATITAQVGSVSNSESVTVESSPLISLSISPLGAPVPAPVTTPFAAIGTFADGTIQNLTASVTWTSSAPRVATIGDSSAKGLAKAVSPGTSTITAVFAGQVGTASLTVADATLSFIIVSPSTPGIGTGTSQQFTATGYFSDGSSFSLTPQVTWTSSTPAVATISSGGLVSSTGNGATTITATLNGVSATAILTVH